MEVLEHWISVGHPTEHEVALRMPLGDVPHEGQTITVPGIGDVVVMTAQRLRGGRHEVGEGEAVVRLDVTAEPERYP